MANAVPVQLEVVYQFHAALVPNEPPLTVRVVEPPLQIVVVPEIPVAAVESVCTVTVFEVQDVVLQVPSALT